jgi:hypothetical protein
MTKIIVSLILVLVSGFAQASGFTVFDNVDSCKIAVSADKAQSYTPTTKAPFAGGKGWTKKVVGAGGACLGQAHVLEDGAPKNGKAVFVPAGFVYWEHTSGAFRMNDCSNPFGQLVAIQPVQTPTSVAQAAEVPIQHGSCTTNDCNTVTEVQVLNQVVVRNLICKDEVTRTTFAPTNGQCNFAPAQANVQMVATSSVACGNTCNNKSTSNLNISGKVARTDNRCVVKLSFNGSSRYVRLSPEKGTGRLMAAVVDNEQAEFNRSNPIVYVGADNAFLHANSTCEAAIEGFSSNRSYAPTIRKLGLPDCTFVGKV